MQKFTRFPAPTEKAALMAVPVQIRLAEAMTSVIVNRADPSLTGAKWHIAPYVLGPGKNLRLGVRGVYVLVCPETGRLRYVGSSGNIGKRYPKKTKGGRNSPGRQSGAFFDWFVLLELFGLSAKIYVVERADTREEAVEKEEFWIHWFRGIGHADLNVNLYPHSGSTKTGV